MRCSAMIGFAVACGSDHTREPLSACRAVDGAATMNVLASAVTATNAVDAAAATGELIFDAADLWSVTDPCGAGSIDFGSGICTTTMCALDIGTIAVSGNTMTLAVTYGYGGTEFERYRYDFTLDGSVTVRDNNAAGNLRLHETISVAGIPLAQPAKYDTTIEYSSVELDSTGCPVAGSLYAVGTSNPSSVNAIPPVPGTNVDGSATFGPGCGDVQ